MPRYGRRRKTTRRRKSVHPSLRKNAAIMSELGRRYRNGEFGNMSWKAVVKKYMGKGSKRSRSASSFGRKRRHRRKSSKSVRRHKRRGSKRRSFFRL